MSRFKTLKIAALNIKTQPHSMENYVKLFQDSFRINALGKIRGSDWGIIGSMNQEGTKDNVILQGIIYRYLNIDPNAPWLDLKNLIPLDEMRPNATPIIPPHLKPNLKRISYIFYPKVHRFFFACKDITPGGMMLLMDDLFKNKIISNEYGKVDVIVESTREAIRRILAMDIIRRLYIDFTKPNDDTLGSAEQQWLDKIEKWRVRKIQQNMTSTDEKGIDAADDEIKAFMNIARSNGKVLAKGYENEKKVFISTDDHPYIEMITYNPNAESESSVMRRTSEQMIKKIKQV